MIYRFNKDDGSCETCFSVKERIKIFFKGKLVFKKEIFKHVSNTLAKALFEWNCTYHDKFRNKIADSITNETDKEKFLKQTEGK